MSNEHPEHRRGEPGVQEHYARLAPLFAQHWTYSEAFVSWMSARLIAHAGITDGDQVLDVGCGPALYAQHIAAHTARPVVCADPSPSMIDHFPSSSQLVAVQAGAEDLASGEVALPAHRFDAIVVKEALHHVPSEQRENTLHGLMCLLAPGGRLLVVMLPPEPGHPLFAAALRRFAKARFTPATVAAMLTAQGAQVETHEEKFLVTMPTERYLGMVTDRYMSLLERFSDDELAAGVTEIRRVHPEEQLAFLDRYMFVIGSLDSFTPSASA